MFSVFYEMREGVLRQAPSPDKRDGTLIDIENDPCEERNLIRNPALAETVSELHEKQEQWLAKT